MAPRLTVRTNGTRYCVWDGEKNAIAMSPDRRRYYDELGLDEAFALADQLAQPPSQAPPTHQQQPTQESVQQQQQLQPKKD
jgi:hypothetical protein